MDDDTNWWKTDLVNEIFRPEEAAAILSMKIENRGAPDRWTWHHTANGKYTVKTAYHMITENFMVRPQAAPSQLNKKFWNRFWKLRVPHRAKHFAWRLLTDFLPTNANLRARTMEVSITCPLCQEENGSAMHLFFECSFAEKLWRTAGLWDVIEAARKPRGDTWFRELITNNEEKTAELVLMYCDALWFQRNQRTFTDKKQEADYLAVSVNNHLQVFHSANGWPERHSDALQESSLLNPLPSGPRIHFDAGIHEGKAGSGAVALTAEGGFIRAEADVLRGVTDPLFAEAAAIQLALEITDDLSLADVQIVGDCLQLIKMIRDEDEVPLGLATIIHELRCSLANGRLRPPCWVPRDQNKAADSLARHAKLSLSGRTIWDAPPTFLLSNDAGHFQ